uniref:Protein GrpE n=1 Tax=candidate division WOR-3 bacterium TaxID=2052148 RepID=A0A7C3N8T3_UNCW3
MAKKRRIVNKEIKLLNKSKKTDLIEDKGEKVKLLEDDNQKLKEEIDTLKTQIKELNDKYLRKIAEYENQKKLLKKEFENISEEKIVKMLKEILNVVDNFDRAIDAFNKTDDKKSIIDGLKMIDNQFHQVLEKVGVSKLECKGESFDPSKHEALSVICKNELPDGVVVEECQRGYCYNSKVIRPAKVIVNKKDEDNEINND